MTLKTDTCLVCKIASTKRERSDLTVFEYAAI